MRIDDFQDLELSPEEQQELQESLRLVEQAFAREEEPPLPEGLTGAALLHLLDGVEQEEPAPGPTPEPEKRPAGRLLLGLFPRKYAAVAAMLAVAVAVGSAYSRLPQTSVPSSDRSGSASSAVAEDVPLLGSAAPDESGPAGESVGARDYAEVIGSIGARRTPDQTEGASTEAEPQQAPKQESSAPEELPVDDAGEEETSSRAVREKEQEDREDSAPKRDRERPDSGIVSQGSEETPEPAAGEGGEQPLMQSAPPAGSSAPDSASTPPANDALSAPESSEAAGEDPVEDAAAPRANSLEEDPPEAIAYSAAYDEAAAPTPPVVSSACAAGNDYRLEIYPDGEDGRDYVLSVYLDGTGQQLGSVPLEEQVEYQRLLSYGSTLVAVGNLTSYPEEYLKLNSTLPNGAGSVDNRDNYTEMSVLNIYTLDGDASQPQLVASHYQAGTLVDAGVTGSGVLMTVTDKDLYEGEGVADYLTESIPVVYDGSSFQYLPSGSIFIDGEASVRDCYTVISRCDLTGPAAFTTVAYLGDTPEGVTLSDSGVYLAQVLEEIEGSFTRVLRFAADNIRSLLRSDRLEGRIYDRVYSLAGGYSLAVTLPDGQEDTGGGILLAEATVLDPGLAAVSRIQLDWDPEWSSLYWDAGQSCLVVQTSDGTVTVDLSDPLAPVTR